MKNKKLLLLFCIPLVLTILILPLCSFINSNSPDYYPWESLHDISVGYVYRYNSASTYGTIEKCNRVFSSSQYDEFKWSDVVFDASGYNILGSPSLKINYVKGNSSFTSSNDKLRVNLVTTGGNAERSLAFDATFRISGYIDGDNIAGYAVEFPNVEGLNGYNVICLAEYLYVENGTLWTNNVEVNYFVSGQSHYVPMSSVYDAVIQYMNNNSIDPLFITSMDCQFFTHDGFGSFNLVSTDSIIVEAPIIPSYAKYAIQLDVVRDYFYNLGYVDGENHGLSTAPQVWGSISDFLENTIGGFLEFEFVDGVTFGGLISVFLGFILVFAFLKIFAGG